MARIDDDAARRGRPRGADDMSRRGDAAEGWAIGPDGERMWGRHGAAGLLAIDPDRGVLMQHRADWNHFGGTWGIPGGALGVDESPIAGALREANEETAIDPTALEPLFTRVRDLGYWQYTTYTTRVVHPVEVYAADAESAGVAWVAPAELSRLHLHPAFGEDWPTLHALARHRPALIIDVANVVGARADGWWRDPAAAAARLLGRCAALSVDGIDASVFGLDAQRVWPEIIGVLEGRSRSAALPERTDERAVARLSTAIAAGSGDEEIVAVARDLVDAAPGRPVVVATSDRERARRLAAHGVGTIGGGRMRTLLDEAGAGHAARPEAASPAPGNRDTRRA